MVPEVSGQGQVESLKSWSRKRLLLHSVRKSSNLISVRSSFLDSRLFVTSIARCNINLTALVRFALLRHNAASLAVYSSLLEARLYIIGHIDWGTFGSCENLSQCWESYYTTEETGDP